MSHPIHRVTRFDIAGPYTLTLQFDDGSQQQIDFRPVLEGEVFAPLQDLTLFNAVELDPTFGTIQWPNGADFDPETLHDWPKYRDDLVAMARKWAQPSKPAHRPGWLTSIWSRRALASTLAPPIDKREEKR